MLLIPSVKAERNDNILGSEMFTRAGLSGFREVSIASVKLIEVLFTLTVLKRIMSLVLTHDQDI